MLLKKTHCCLLAWAVCTTFSLNAQTPVFQDAYASNENSYNHFNDSYAYSASNERYADYYDEEESVTKSTKDYVVEVWDEPQRTEDSVDPNLGNMLTADFKGLAVFDATALDGFVELAWETDYEQKVIGFELERSVDGTQFSKIATIESIGNSQEGASYLHIDDSSHRSSNLFYRIKVLLDDDTSLYRNLKITFKYSDAVDFELIQDNQSGNSVFVFQSNYNNIVQVEVFSKKDGTSVFKKQIEVREGRNSVMLPMKDRDPGVYFVQFSEPGGTSWTGKLVNF
jgi:hypothetical protein